MRNEAWKLFFSVDKCFVTFWASLEDARNKCFSEAHDWVESRRRPENYVDDAFAVNKANRRLDFDMYNFASSLLAQ